MKTLLLCAVLMLSGCSVLLVPHWNATEYNEYVTIAAESSSGTCTPEQTQRLSVLSTHAKLYSEYLPHNSKIAEGAVKMDETIQGLDKVTQGSTFCQLKLRIIKQMATTLAEAVGGKPQ